MVVRPTTLTLWVSLIRWRKGFPVIAGLSLSSPPWGNARILLLLDISFWGWTLEILFVGWTPRLCLSNSKFRSTTRFLLHNDSLVGWTPGPLFFGWTPRPSLSNSKNCSLTRLLLHKDVLLVGPLGYYFWVGPLAFAFQIHNFAPYATSHYTTIFWNRKCGRKTTS